MSFQIGDKIGDYRIIGVLGAGGQAMNLHFRSQGPASYF